MRIDKLLWFLRFAPSRNSAQEWVAAGHIRLNGRRIERASAAVREGDVLVLPLRSHVKVIELLALPERRGPAPEAQACYRVLDAGTANPIAAAITSPDSDRPEHQGEPSP
ncbi:RNA-binding S4 domain-containing protein [Novosphingobium flavum]|uniref:RNA-binding S4 domain-containing protein n=1 Tax=Novosphingobium flavum TaxID=1778672 RepID=A0A7X1KKI0_9SPHN|nr:S4 domain-containing protein [Novosphingobium flavum]MBC2664527.1 RNA-binding S4 domain-containing protein [Novosphingobium flavum]